MIKTYQIFTIKNLIVKIQDKAQKNYYRKLYTK
jgi:hypothetical protein